MAKALATFPSNNDLTYVGGISLETTQDNAYNVCYYDTINTNVSLWKNSSPFVKNVPLFAAQLSLMIFLIRLFFFVLTRQPRFFAELITACVVGPVFGRFTIFREYIRKLNSNVVLETTANLGLVYYMFLVGLEIDVNMIKRVGKKALCNAVAGILFSMGMGAGLYFLFVNATDDYANPLGGLFCGVALTVTSFPDLVQVLSDIHLLNTDLGRMALSSAYVNDLTSWATLIVEITLLHGNKNLFIFPTVGFVIFSWLVVRPTVRWVITKTSSEDGRISDSGVYIILTGILLCGFITDACGSHSMAGAFILGLLVPKEELNGTRIMDQFNDFVTGILLPAFLLIAGGRIDLVTMMSNTSLEMLLLVILMACSAKILSSLIVSKIFGMSVREGIALGFLMNTKGILALIVIGVGRDFQALDNATYTAMVIVFTVMTALVKPIPYWACKAPKNLRHYENRTIEGSKVDSEFRVILCIHARHNLSGMTTLLKFSNSTVYSPIYAFVLYLVELKGRSTAMLIVHDPYESSNLRQSRKCDRDGADLGIDAFEIHGNTRHNITIQPMSVVSPYDTMHGDICNIAEDKRVTFILVPYHKQLIGNEVLQDNSCIKTVNQNLLIKSPCSVGVFIDRGLHLNIQDTKSKFGREQIQVAMPFAGGPDDREALAYACRMAACEDVSLTVLRFLPGKEAKGRMEKVKESENKKQEDDRYVNEFRFLTMCDERITYIEQLVNNGEEIIRIMKETCESCDLYIVGRGQEASPLTFGLSEWKDCKELGALGDALSTSEFATKASILVIRQY